MGHLMMTAGIDDAQLFWCNLCCAYTGDRVRKLAKVCDRVTRNVPAVNALRQSRHPFTGTQLVVSARRVVKADVGHCRVTCDAHPNRQCIGDADLVMSHHGTVSGLCATTVHPQPFFFEEADP